MKPDWKDAPEWANFMAMDCNDDWYWYEKKPELICYCWRPVEGTNYQIADTQSDPFWEDTLEPRPATI